MMGVDFDSFCMRRVIVNRFGSRVSGEYGCVVLRF